MSGAGSNAELTLNYLLPCILKTKLLFNTYTLLTKATVHEQTDKGSTAGYDNVLLLNQ